MKKIIITCLLAGTVFSNPVAIKAFLATAKDDFTLAPQREKIDFLKSTSSNTPVLNEIELRGRVQEMDITKPLYTVRLTPNGWGEARHGKKMYRLSLKYNSVEYDLLLNDALKQRYRLVLEHLFRAKMLSLSKELAVLYADRINVLKKSAASLEFDFNDLINAEDDDMKLQLDLINMENNLDEVGHEIKSCLALQGALAFDTAHFVSPADIRAVLKTTDTAITPANIHLKSSKLRMDYSKARYRLEQAENRNFVSYLEARMDRDNDTFKESMAAGLGIRIPIVNPNRLDINRRRLASMENKTRYENTLRRLGEKISAGMQDLDRLLRQYDMLAARKSGSKAESSLALYQKMEGIDPLILLKLKESTIKTEMTLQKITFRVYSEYIDLLDISGSLVEKPYKNYLSKDREQFK